MEKQKTVEPAIETIESKEYFEAIIVIWVFLSKIIEISAFDKTSNNPQLTQGFQEITSDKPTEEENENDDDERK